MFRSGRNSVKEEKILDIGKGEIIKKLQNQSHNLTLDLESLKLCQKNLAYEKDLQEPAKIKLGYLLENMIDKIQEELEDIVRMINTLHHCHEVDDDILKEVDLLNLRYSKLALQTEKVFVSSPLFMELRTKGDISYMPLNEDLRNSNAKRTDKSMRDYVTESPALKERHNRSFTAQDNDNRPYMKDTFNSRLNKDLSNRKIESIDRTKSQRSIMKSPKRARNAFTEVNSEWIDDLLKQFGNEEEVNRHQKLSTSSTKYVTRAESPSLRQPPKSAQVTNTSRKTVFDVPPTSDVVKREILSLKNLYLELREKLDSHTHTDYETQLEKLRYENTKVLSDNKVLQKDNSELMHTLFDIKKDLKELKDENHKLKKEISRLKAVKETAPQEEPSRPIERLSVKREQQSIQDDKNQSRFLLQKTKNSLSEEEELAASWVKRRLA